MASRKIESQLEALAKLKEADPATPEVVASIDRFLADPLGLIVGKAARLTAHFRLKALTPSLLSAYDRLFVQPVKRDQQCSGKTAIVQALTALDHSEAGPYVRGLYYQQWEPTWGTLVDTAPPLRAACCVAIPQCLDLVRDDKLLHLMRALTDKASAVRLEAIRSVEQMEGREAALLLRLKASMGDEDVALTGQAIQSVLAMEGEHALPFVRQFVEQFDSSPRDEELFEQTVLALGASRVPSGVDFLIECCSQDHYQSLRPILFRGLSLSRHEKAVQFLLEILSDGRLPEALAALEVLGTYLNADNIRSEVHRIVTARESPELESGFRRAFQ